MILYPQSGGFLEYNITAPTVQLGGGCWDGYGQTGPEYAWADGPQVASVRAMVEALAGPAIQGSAGRPRRAAAGGGSDATPEAR